MKTLFILLLSIIYTPILLAQNLVQNSDFEDLESEFCGIISSSQDFENSMNDWIVANNGTPDIFLTTIVQSCWNYQPNSTYPGAIGVKGSQDPHSGNNFVGIFAYTIEGLNQRDYIQVALSSPMEIGELYVVEFYVSLADSTEFASDNFGAYLSTTAISSSNDGPLNYEPQVEFEDFVSDTENWVRIADTLTADDNYEFITIGNFKNDENTSTLENPTYSSGIGCYGAYYFIDDVSISPLQNTGINELSENYQVNIFPIPFYSYISIESKQELQNASLRFYDICGQLLSYNYYIVINEIKVDTKGFPNGYYIIEIEHDNGVFHKKILKSN